LVLFEGFPFYHRLQLQLPFSHFVAGLPPDSFGLYLSHLRHLGSSSRSLDFAIECLSKNENENQIGKFTYLRHQLNRYVLNSFLDQNLCFAFALILFLIKCGYVVEFKPQNEFNKV
jgi:hypothetical protein